MKRAGGRLAARRIPTLEDLREVLLGKHPECARVQVGGAPRMLPIAQVVCDSATPQGQAIVAAYLETAKSEQGLARYQARREGLGEAIAGRRRELDERALVARRVAMKDALEALGATWEAENRNVATVAKRSAA